MALPTKVVDRLAWESPATPGWTWHLLMFTMTVFFVIVLAYLGLHFGYETYLNQQIADLTAKTDNLKTQVSSDEQAGVLDFYAQATNLQKLLAGHVLTSKVFSWLESKTEANVYFTDFSFDATTGKTTLGGAGKTIDDVEQQMAAFEAEPGLSQVVFSNAAPAQNGGWQFKVAFTMSPSLFAEQATSTLP